MESRFLWTIIVSQGKRSRNKICNLQFPLLHLLFLWNSLSRPSRPNNFPSSSLHQEVRNSKVIPGQSEGRDLLCPAPPILDLDHQGREGTALWALPAKGGGVAWGCGRRSMHKTPGAAGLRRQGGLSAPSLAGACPGAADPSEMAPPSVPSPPASWANASRGEMLSLDEAALPADYLALRISVALAYGLVGTVGLLGNVAALWVLGGRRASRPTTDSLVFSLALADLGLALTFPFWAAEYALDFHWPFGGVLCKAVLTGTVLSVYASVFLITALSLVRYWMLAVAAGPGACLSPSRAFGTGLAAWVAAGAAAAPTAVFGAEAEVGGVQLCLLRFPSIGWLGAYQVQKVLLAFVAPLSVVAASYLLLWAFLRRQRLRRRDQAAARALGAIVASFFLCWLPNHVVTLWGVLVKFDLVPWDATYSVLHTYVFPLTVCLARSNSCLNPLLYCFLRRECRRALGKALSGLRARLPGAGRAQPKQVALQRRSRPKEGAGARKGGGLSTTLTHLDKGGTEQEGPPP
ncbi:relaxin-3 receptor 2 [Antechinus flavipes]|uniref:relaxin-3 receptor 2 n=1 Tax=Antechinus flavipes TaxID=38775 RepID=UPI002235CB5B|nr:relaxin-3 receptor 2 [Antechinus flavipes]